MSMMRGSSSAEIPAPIDACWAAVEDPSQAPEWQQGLVAMTVVERDEQGRPLVCDSVTDAKFRTVTCRVRFSYDPPHRLAFTRISGDLSAMDGSWELEALSEERTRATYSLALDPGKVGLLARPLEKALRPLVVGGRAQELVREVGRRGAR